MKLPLHGPTPSSVLFRPLFVIVLSVALVSCGSTRNASDHGGLARERGYRPGWHLELVKQDRKPSPTDAFTTSNPSEPGPMDTPRPEAGAFVAHEPDKLRTPPAVPVRTYDRIPPTIAPVPGRTEVVKEARPDVRDRDPDNIMPRKRFNAFAIPALLVVLGGVSAAFLTNSGWLVAGLLVLGLLLAAISLRRIRSREQSGKSIALAALIIGLVAALITAMVIIRSGF
jgi:hypothetical protein